MTATMICQPGFECPPPPPKCDQPGGCVDPNPQPPPPPKCDQPGGCVDPNPQPPPPPVTAKPGGCVDPNPQPPPPPVTGCDQPGGCVEPAPPGYVPPPPPTCDAPGLPACQPGIPQVEVADPTPCGQFTCNYTPSTRVPYVVVPTTVPEALLNPPNDDCMSDGTTRYSFNYCGHAQLGSALVAQAPKQQLPATGIDTGGTLGTAGALVLLGVILYWMRKPKDIGR